MTGLEALGAAALASASAAASSVPAWVPTAVTAATTAASAGLAYGSHQQQAGQQKIAGELNARESERAAAEARGDAGRKAAERRLKEEALLSRQRAVAASGGAGAGETEGFSDIVGDTAERGEFLVQSDLAIGENQARGFESRAAISRWDGNAKAATSQAKGTAALVNAGFDIAGSALKRRPMTNVSDDFVFEEYGNNANAGFHTVAKRSGPARGGRYYKL